MQNLDFLVKSIKKQDNISLFNYYKKIDRKLHFSNHDFIINEIINKANLENNPKNIIDLFIITFMSRDYRNGKGEKSSFYRIVNILYSKFPETTISLIECIPIYGYWKDLLLLIDETKKNPIIDVDYRNLENKIYKVYCLQLLEDYAKYKSNLNDISLAAKFAPREGKSFDKKYNSVSKIIKILFPEIVGPHLRGSSKQEIKNEWNKAKRIYSNIITNLSTVLDVAEIKICSGKFKNINFEKIPVKCLFNNLTAFKGTYNCHLKKYEKPLHIKNLEKYFERKIKKPRFPHEIIQDFFSEKILKKKDEIFIKAEWQHLINEVKKSFVYLSNKNKIFLDKTFTFYNAAIMDEESYDTAFGFATLISYLNTRTQNINDNIDRLRKLQMAPNKSNKFKYEYYELKCLEYRHVTSMRANIAKLKELKSLIRTTFDYKINIYELFNDIISENRVFYKYPIKDLIIFTSESYNNLLNKKMILNDYMNKLPNATIPKIIFWDISSNIDSFPKETGQKHIYEMSGKSPEFLQNLLDIDIQQNSNGFKNKISYNEFQNKIADSRYDSIRAKLALSNEGILENFANSDPNDALLFE